MTYPPQPPEGNNPSGHNPYISGDRYGQGGNENAPSQRPFPGYDSYGHQQSPPPPYGANPYQSNSANQHYGRYSNPSTPGNMAGFSSRGAPRHSLARLAKIWVIFTAVTLLTVGGVVGFIYLNTDSSFGDGGDFGSSDDLHDMDWYSDDWEMPRDDVREGNEGETHTAWLDIVDSWEYDDCPTPLAEGEDASEFDQCVQGIEGNYERTDLELKVCQRVFEFDNSNDAAAIEAEYDPEDMEAVDSTPMSCQTDMDGMDQFLTQVTAYDEYLTMTVGGWSLSDPTDDEQYEILTAVSYRHTEISNATMWL